MFVTIARSTKYNGARKENSVLVGEAHMAMQLPKGQRKQRSSKVTPLRVVEHPNAFGAHLVHVRNRTSLPQQEVADALPEYFKEYNVTFPTGNPRDMYRKTEKGIRAAQFEELIPLY